ncbi:hypothetical protein [Pyxidicoccus xibeiensis]|uniref:hypothetical protein n=1 Tax=Pyxidicoccus xibeiensis TaxID=2906759 RepID=UPI0020A700F9|nr:hypothetical protein [Pyxidicoccus xibeiensis]MCP3139649.1 hypothetical protein [Pyxidicoccus xibeiensis]
MQDTPAPQPSPEPLPEPPRGLGPLFFLLLLWLLPAGVAGVLRTALGLPLWPGALAGAALLSALAWKATSGRAPWPTHLPLAALQVLYVIVAMELTWRLLGIPALGGLVTMGGGDAGNHAALRALFVTTAPGTYQGFVLFYAVSHALERLFGLDAFTSFRATFYLVPAVLAVALAAGLEVAVSRLWSTARALLAAQVALLVGTVGVWWFLLLKLLHYHQADGFYAHIFGLVPLVLGWLAYALPRSPWARCLALAAFTVFYRYTYGLNLPDLLFTGGVLVLLEGPRLGARYRRWTWPVGLLLIAAAVYAMSRLLPLAGISGGLLVHSYERALRVQCWTVVGLCVVRFCVPRAEGVERRLLDFTLLFAGVNALAQLAYLGARLPIEYYFLKYGFHAVLLLLLTVLLVASLRVGALFQAQPPRARAWSVGLAVLVAVMLVEVSRGWGRAFRVYEDSYAERIRGTPPFQFMDALEDRGATARIRRVLRDERKRFGGLLGPSWPRVNFSNVALGWVPADGAAGNGHWSVFENGTVREGPGTCVFWEASAADWEAYQRVTQDGYPRLEASVRRLHARPDKVCQEHPAPWAPGGTRTLCHRCD